MAQTWHAPKQASLLVNTRSHKGTAWLDRARTELQRAGFELTTDQGFVKVRDLLDQVKKEMGDDKLVIVGAGDGTLSAVANVLAKTETILGVLPLGTGNAFARDLSIPTSLPKAVQVLKEGTAVKVDLGVCQDRYFVNVATIGLTVDIARALTVPLKRRFGRFGYAFAIAKAYRNMRSFKVNIETENGMTDLNAIQVVIGNGHYHAGPLPLSPHAAITSGRLRLYAVEACSTADLLKYILILPTGLQGALKAVHSEGTTGGKITTEPTQSVVVDGEISARTPLTFSAAHEALRVMAPKDFTG